MDDFHEAISYALCSKFYALSNHIEFVSLAQDGQENRPLVLNPDKFVCAGKSLVVE